MEDRGRGASPGKGEQEQAEKQREWGERPRKEREGVKYI
jgi:hypothetical protein